MIRPLRWYGLLCALLAFSACTNFDREDRLEDLRVLAVRTEPAELFVSPLYLLPTGARPPLPSADVRMEVFAYDPRGGNVVVTSRLCTREEGRCIAEIPEDDRSSLAGIHTPSRIEQEVDNLDTDPTGRIRGLDYPFEFTENDIASFMPFGIFSEYVYLAMDVDNPNQDIVARESAFKRFPVSLNLWDPSTPPELRASLVEQLQRSFGVALCDERVPDDEYQEGPTTCVEPREANENPSLLGFRILEADERPADGVLTTDEASPDVGVRSLLRVSRGATLRVEPIFAPGVRERYQIIGYTIEDSALFIENRLEDTVASWYSTAGNVSTGQSTLQFDGNLAISWALPQTGIAAGQRDSLIVVIRDQRGGAAVGQITVEYR